MSIKVMSWVWDNQHYQGAKKLMLLAIADHCNDDGVCFPGVARLAEKCNVSHRRAQQIIADLESDGVIRKGQNEGIKTVSGHTNRYYLQGYIDDKGVMDPSPPTNTGVMDPSSDGVMDPSSDGVKDPSPKPSVEPSVEPSENNTPLPPEGASDWLLDELKAYGIASHIRRDVAHNLRQQARGKKSAYNLEGEPIQRYEVPAFYAYWRETHAGLTHPCNKGSFKTHFEAFRNSADYNYYMTRMDAKRRTVTSQPEDPEGEPASPEQIAELMQAFKDIAKGISK